MAAKASTESINGRRAWGFLLLPLCLFIALSLFSYDWKDIDVLRASADRQSYNLIGPVGAWLSFGLFTLLGVGAYTIPFLCLAFGLILILDSEERIWKKGVAAVVFALTFAALAELSNQEWHWWARTCWKLNIVDTGGIISFVFMRGILMKWLSVVGAGILVGSVLVASVVYMIGVSTIVRAYQLVVAAVQRTIELAQDAAIDRLDKKGQIDLEQRKLEKKRKRLERVMEKEKASASTRMEEEPEPISEPEPVPKEEPAPRKKVRAEKPKKQEPISEPEEEVAASPEYLDYKLPPIDLLEAAPADKQEVETDTGMIATILVETLAEFGIEAEVTNVQKGPVVTRYELLPAPGVRVEKISGLSNNLALALKATSVRVQAPIPGKGVVGIEVPNSTAKMVVLRSMLESEKWASRKLHIPLALGQDVGGNDMVADLAEMPHLLIAGATGAGKTVCMNSILAGLLMSRRPDQLRLMLVDPKIVEFAAYQNLPHLVVPVITDAKKVALGLRWAINEMEKRYKLFAKVGVRNIDGYNTRERVEQADLFGEEHETQESDPPATLPYIVIVIDELADLMLVDQAEIENSVARLAQLSRAVGIHMILSTQRPSVNVITGTIKANFPARIAFQVAQKVDSRTILDAVGAEKLLGRGDMLFLPPGASKLVRAQGALTSDEEIKKITDFIKEQAGPSFEVEIHEKLDKPFSKLDIGEDDDLLSQSVEIIRETRRASTSSLQRRLRIGYTRAARIMDILEERGIIGPPRGSDPREILIDLDGIIPDNPIKEETVEE